MKKSRFVLVFLAAVAAIAWGAPAGAQITTGSVTGVVVDAQGAVVPGATVVLISETQGTKMAPVVTNAAGSYTVPNIKADTYSVEVSLASFKTVTRKGVKVSGGDRVAVEALTLQVGGQTETVTVEAVAPVIQSASGERSGVIAASQLQNLPSGTGHNFTEFLSLIPGVTGTAKIGGSGQSNFMIDGISAMDTGNNGLMGGLNLPVDQVAEVKVITSGYNAEYGRSIGLQVSAVTKSGTNQFRGSVYDYERHSKWNWKNGQSWAGNLNGTTPGVNDQRDWGYTIGGPVGKPGGSNKLFFFYTSEYQPRKSGNNTTNLRVPTALERQGDFSETRDNVGALYNFIYDASTGLPKSNCSATSQTACFAAGGVLGRVPTNRLYGPGIALLNQYPLPVCPGAACPNWTSTSSYNWSNLSPITNTLTFKPTYRVDYQLSSNLRATGKWSGTTARVQPNIGNIPGFNDTIQKFPLSFNSSGTINYSFNATTFLEATYGMNQNRLGTPPINDPSNRNNVTCPANLAAVISNCTLGAIAFPLGGDVAVNPKYYEYKALGEIGVPFLDATRNVFTMQPVMNFGGTRIANAPPSQTFPGFMNINRTQDVSINLTKVWGKHTGKAGFYLNHSYKAQNTGAGGGAPSFQGALNVGVDANNPFDSQMAFSNTALGVFSSYGQQSPFIEGSFLYNNIEWYLQDNWKVNRKLTLDYGVRFVHQGPQWDQFLQVSTFRPETWTLGNAPYLYVPGCLGGTATCSGTNRVAKDPRTGQLLGAGTSGLVGNVIIGSGDGANGLTQAGNGIAKTGYLWPWLALAPRFGFAYDLSGKQAVVFRGSLGMFYDRPDGNSVFSTVSNPPVVNSTTMQWGFLQALQNTDLKFGPVPLITSFQYDSKLPKDVQWNGGVQIALPWASALDFEYVGHHAYDTLSASGGASATNINSIDIGTYLPAGTKMADGSLASGSGIDPTATTATQLNANLVRAYRGYQAININMGRYYRTFHSVQASYNRRFSHGVSFGVNWNWAIYDVSNQGFFRINHNPDGTYVVRPDNATALEMFGDRGTTDHTVKGNFVWSLPQLKSENKAFKAIGMVINDWQLSGIFTMDSGAKYDVGFSYNGINSNSNLTGSTDYSARIVIPDMSVLGGGCDRGNRFSQFNNVMAALPGGGFTATSSTAPVTAPAYRGPQVGSVGLESGQNYLTGCGARNLDLAIQRTIRLGGSRSLQLRADVFNALNLVNFNGRSSSISFNSPTDFSVRNSQYVVDSTGQLVLDPTRLLPQNAGFGSVTGASAMRSVQGQIRFSF